MCKAILRFGLTGVVISCVAIASNAQNNDGLRAADDDVGEVRAFSGVWLREFEGSTFLEGVTTATADIGERLSGARLYIDSSVGPSVEELFYDSVLDCYPVYAFELTFIGRERELGDRRGYLSRRRATVGASRAEIEVVELLDIEQISGPYCYDQSVLEYFEARDRSQVD